MRICKFLFVLFLLLYSATANSQLRINELMAANAGFEIETDFYNFADWLEIHNSGSESLNLGNYYLSDKPDNLTLFAIPDSTVIPPGGFLTIYADGEARQGPLHTSFRLNPEGEQVYLSPKVGEHLLVKDSVYYEYLLENNSYGRYEDGTGTWFQMAIMTPGRPNEPFQVHTNPVFFKTNPSFQVYPNPVADHLFIRSEGLDPHSAKYFVEMVDITGKTVFPRTWLNQSETLLNLTWLNGGLYIVRILEEKALVQTSGIVVIK